jgi:hypothetical protein
MSRGVPHAIENEKRHTESTEKAQRHTEDSFKNSVILCPKGGFALLTLCNSVFQSYF